MLRALCLVLIMSSCEDHVPVHINTVHINIQMGEFFLGLYPSVSKYWPLHETGPQEPGTSQEQPQASWSLPVATECSALVFRTRARMSDCYS